MLERTKMKKELFHLALTLVVFLAFGISAFLYVSGHIPLKHMKMAEWGLYVYMALSLLYFFRYTYKRIF